MNMKLPKRKPDRIIDGMNIWKRKDHLVASVDLKDGNEFIFAVKGWQDKQESEYLTDFRYAFFSAFMKHYAIKQ